MSDTVSAEFIKAQMPNVTLTQILEEPSHRQLKQLKHEVTTNVMVVPCPWGHNKRQSWCPPRSGPIPPTKQGAKPTSTHSYGKRTYIYSHLTENKQ
jgi:hypothetical protein